MEERIIYCVVARSVQTPLEYRLVSRHESEIELTKPFLLPGTKTITQTTGRIAAQAIHAVSQVRYRMLWQQIQGVKAHDIPTYNLERFCDLIPTIVLEAKDSFELNYLFHNLRNHRIPVHEFWNWDSDDSSGKVCTAITTEPVFPFEVKNLLQSCSLWLPDASTEKMKLALERIERWFGEFPDTNQFWDEAKTAPLTYGMAYGSNGERDFMRSVARESLR